MFKLHSTRRDRHHDDDDHPGHEAEPRGVDDEADGPTAGHSGSMLSALFLLVFAIAVIVPWTVADSARQNTYAEAQALTEAYWDAGGLPPDDAAMVRDALTDYTAFVADREWQPMRHGRLDPEGWTMLDTLRGDLGRLPLKGDQADARDDVTDQLTAVYAARRQRAVDAGAPLPGGVLVLTVITAGLVLAFPLLAGARPRGKVWLPFVLMVGSLLVSVYLVFSINHTFSGPLGVDDSAYRTAQQEYARVP